jgi:hypothetical protein
MVPFAIAEEGGGNTYSLGSQPIYTGYQPPPVGGIRWCGGTTFYVASRFNDAHGKSAIPGFHLVAMGTGFEVKHTWNVHVLGGMLGSSISPSFVYEDLSVGADYALGAPSLAGLTVSSAKFGLGNGDIEPIELLYKKGTIKWYHAAVFGLRSGPHYNDALLNIGQNEYTISSYNGATWIPKFEFPKWDLSTRLIYSHHLTDTQTHYHSGDEIYWEYMAQRHVTKRGLVGFQGFSTFQLTDDRQNGMVYANGFRDRAVAWGGLYTYFIGNSPTGETMIILKYVRETMVQNRPQGNVFWLCMQVPLKHGHHDPRW